ncbi:hypothetical protein SEPL_411 [Salmonella phage SE_PL]|uniref:hypothetical protein n=1 Tax=Salmonella enterica TaxID=28901 RepID=UPI0011642303|nr:hypothetical protein [Salmonella enterica subsp. enterica serovar Kentucky]QCW18678.1 hypothetical protein 7t3_0157 [Salmonella phage 7t3]QIG63024.1 hypothetical protein SEPL_411 [Salmonella phage SE_PL]WNV47119.1 hypothetical protein [Klebsiella phage fENko-Kae01]WNV47634.1 hypothetical protein [Klebsiella phage fENko-Kae01]
MRTPMTREEIHTVLTTNIQDWKKYADINEAQDLNNELDGEDLDVICSPEFYDDIHSDDDVWNVLEKHFLDTDLSIYSRDTFILIHNIYNK